MSMIDPQFPDETPTPVSKRTLRQFAALCLGVFGLLFALSWYRHGGRPGIFAWIAATIAVFVGMPGLIWPFYVRPVFSGLMAVTQPIGHVMSMIALGLIYFVFLTPLALIFRWMGRDVLKRRQAQTDSYWVPRLQSDEPRQYLRQYQKQQADGN